MDDEHVSVQGTIPPSSDFCSRTMNEPHVLTFLLSRPSLLTSNVQSEYDIAVIETQARRPVSVKVKQFSLQGARIQNDWQGPQMVKYKNKLHPWKYIVVLPVARNPIKISSPNLVQLKPVHEGIRRVLLAQQRGSAGVSHPTSSRSMQPQPNNDPRQVQSEPRHYAPYHGQSGSGYEGGGHNEQSYSQQNGGYQSQPSTQQQQYATQSYHY
jgi:hypothetical protein